MAQDPSIPGDRPAALVCPWCSAALTADATICPSCGANLTADGEPVVPGLTAVDQEALRRAKQAPTQSRSRLMSWISGEYTVDTPTAAEAQAVAPPDVDVRREIMRLELEAEVAKLQAEADAILSEAAVEGRVVDIPEGLRPYATHDALEASASAEGAEAPDVDATQTAEAAEAGSTGTPPAEDQPPA